MLDLGGQVQAAGAEEYEDGVGFALGLALDFALGFAFGLALCEALYKAPGVSFGVELFFDGHGDGLGSGRLPIKNGTDLGEVQVTRGPGDVAQKHDEQLLGGRHLSVRGVCARHEPAQRQRVPVHGRLLEDRLGRPSVPQNGAGLRERSALEHIRRIRHRRGADEPAVEGIGVGARLDAVLDVGGQVQATGAEEYEDGVGLALCEALYKASSVSFSVELFFDGHGDGLGCGRLPVKDGTDLGEVQVTRRPGDVAQKHDEQLLAARCLGEGFEVRRPRRKTPQECVSVASITEQPQGKARGVGERAGAQIIVVAVVEVVDNVLEVGQDSGRDVADRCGEEVCESRGRRPTSGYMRKDGGDDERQRNLGVIVRVACPDPDHVAKQAKRHGVLGRRLEYTVAADCTASSDQARNPSGTWAFIDEPHNFTNNDPFLCGAPEEYSLDPLGVLVSHSGVEDSGMQATLSWDFDGTPGADSTTAVEADMAYSLRSCGEGTCVDLACLDVSTANLSVGGLAIASARISIVGKTTAPPLKHGGTFTYPAGSLQAMLDVETLGTTLTLFATNHSPASGRHRPENDILSIANLQFKYDDSLLSDNLSLDISVQYENRPPLAAIRTLSNPKGCVADASFQAASSDPDNDPVTHVWWAPGHGTGAGPVFDIDLPAGTHPIMLISSDDGGGQDVEVVMIGSNC